MNEIKSAYVPLSKIDSLKKIAVKENLEFELDYDNLWSLYIEQNRKCALSGVSLPIMDSKTFMMNESDNIPYLGRIDSSKGYISGNVRWLHQVVAKMMGTLTDEEVLSWSGRIISNSYREGRPSFDEYFLSLSFDVSLKSDDKFIKHGAVIIDNKSQHIIGTGYNATFRKCDTTAIGIGDRDKRRAWMIHAEENAIMNCVKNPLESVKGATMYITGEPCTNCLLRICNFGINRIVIAQRTGTTTDDKESKNIKKMILKMSPHLTFNVIPMDNKWLRTAFND